MTPDVREITYGRKSIKTNTSNAVKNVASQFYEAGETRSSNIVLIRNITKDKKIGAYSEAPWFDDALR